MSRLTSPSTHSSQSAHSVQGADESPLRTRSTTRPPSLPFFARRGSNPASPSRIQPRDAMVIADGSGETTPTRVGPTGRPISHIDSMEVPARSTSLRRKPVPDLLVLANTSLPASHPFALSAAATSTTSVTPGIQPPSGPSTPGSTGHDLTEDLFYTAPRAGPPPPRRPRSISPALNHSPISMTFPQAAPSATSSTSSHVQRTGRGVGGEESREAALYAREQALRDREEALRQREELLRREESLRRREEELRAREEALSIREQSASPVSTSASSSRPAPVAVGPDTYTSPRQVDTETIPRPLAPVSHPHRPRLADSAESFPALTSQTGQHQSMTGPVHHGAAGLKQRLKLKNRTVSPPRTSGESVTRPPPPRQLSAEKHPKEPFSVDGLPKQEDVLEAATLFLRDENGQLVCFGDFFPHPDSPTRVNVPGDAVPPGEKGSFPPVLRTVVFFIRNFWCGQCQDYTFASLSLLDPVAIRRAGVRVVVISNGSWKIIKAYRKVLHCPFPIYVDGPRRLYHLLGMSKMTNDFGPLFKGRAAYHQRPVPTQVLHGLGNAFFKFPLANPGRLTQLGGEFIFSSGYTCDFAHRMTTTSDHMEAPEVLRRAGVAAPTVSEVQTLQLKEAQRAELDRMTAEMETWRRERAAVLERIQRKKSERRGMKYDPKVNASGLLLAPESPENEMVRPIETTGGLVLENGMEESHTPSIRDIVEAHEAASDHLTLGPEIEEHLDKIIRDLDETERDTRERGDAVLGAGTGSLEVEVETEDEGRGKRTERSERTREDW